MVEGKLVFVTRLPEKVTFTFLKVTFSDERMTFTILKVTFSNEKVTLFGVKVTFSCIKISFSYRLSGKLINSIFFIMRLFYHDFVSVNDVETPL